MKKMIFILFTFLMMSSMILGAETVELDLSEYGIPLTLMAPDDVEISDNDLTLEWGLLVDNEDGFNLYIEVYQEYAEDTTDPGEIAEIYKADLDEMEDFEEIIFEEDGGYIYSTVDEYGDRDYHFLYVIVLDDMELQISEGIILDLFTEEQVRIMYNAVKNAEY